MTMRLRVEVDFKPKGILHSILDESCGAQLIHFYASGMARDFAISEVARVFGLRTSAIRYYERIGILPHAARINGQRRYNNSTLYRLAVIQRARETGFTLTEIRRLCFGFASRTRPPKRWSELCARKPAELEERSRRLQAMQALLKRMEKCDCHALEECGKRLLPHIETAQLETHRGST